MYRGFVPVIGSRTRRRTSEKCRQTMELEIRPIRDPEIPLLEDFLYEAIWQPAGTPPLPREVIRTPALYAYVEAFGQRKGDCCLVAETGGRVVGAVWCRRMYGFGWVEVSVPEMAVALMPAYRGLGIGTRLLKALFDELRRRGVRSVSLSVQRANPAVRLYLRLGFREVAGSAEEVVMRCGW